MSDRRAAALSTAIAIIALMLILGRDLEAATLFLACFSLVTLAEIFTTHGGGS